MPRHHALLFSVAVLAGLPLAALAAPGPVVLPPDSFIDQHVASMSQMDQQVTLDPVVRRRLARHFHTSGPAVVRYIQKNLILKKTTTASRYQVYCISRTGREYTINSRLPAGTPVFVMRSTGKPVLKLACGNPMVASLPPVVTKVSPYTSPELASLPKPTLAAIAPGLAPNGPVVVAMNSGPGIVVTPAPTTKVGGLIQTLPVRGGKFPIGLLAGIPIIAGIVNHGGNTPPVELPPPPQQPPVELPPPPPQPPVELPPPPPPPPVELPPPPQTPTPVPEPGTLAAFAVGAAGLAFLVAKTRRHQAAKS